MSYSWMSPPRRSRRRVGYRNPVSRCGGEFVLVDEAAEEVAPPNLKIIRQRTGSDRRDASVGIGWLQVEGPGGAARGVHKLGRRADPSDLQRDRIYAPHEPGGAGCSSSGSVDRVATSLAAALSIELRCPAAE